MSSQNTQTVLATVVTYIGQELKTGVGSFLDHAEQTLFADTSPRSGTRDRPTSYAAARWLGNNRESLEAAMQQRLTDAFFGRAQRKDVQFDELQLLDDEALGVVIVRARMVSQVMERARDAVVVLEARLEALRAAGADINPKALNPGLVADGFIGVLNELEVPKQVQAPLLDAFGVGGVDMLVKFYDGINKLLIENGVLPDFKRVPVESEHAPARAHGAPPAAGGGGAMAPGPAVPPGVPAGPAPGGAPVPGGTPAAAPYAPVASTQGGAAPAVMLAPGAGEGFVPGTIPVPSQFMPIFLDAKVTLMQQALARLSFEEWQPGTLRDSFKLPPPFALTPEQEESVDHLEAVFLDLMRDPRISARFRQQMSQLILPLMMLRLKESDQLADPDNAVRRFVRQLALLGFRDQDSPIESFDAITTVVGRIVSERAQEIASFRSGADALHTIALKEVQRQLELRQQHLQRREATPPEAAQAAQDDRRRLMREAHQHVLGELRLLSAGMNLPPAVQQYVVRMLGPWMMIRYQRYGVESEAMRDARSFAMMFFRLLAPATSRADHDTKVALRKHALEEMEVRAARSSRLDPELRETILAQIEKLYGELDDDPQAGVRKEFGDSGADCTDYLDGLEEILAG